MDHRKATETHATERYLLGELSAGEAEEFELHYFECAQCALAVESGESFLAAARHELKHEPRHEPRHEPGNVPLKASAPSLWSAVAAFFRKPAFGLAAAAILGAIALYQGTVTIPGLREARALPAFHLIGASRAEDQKIGVPAKAPFFQLDADIPPDAHFRGYLCVISSGGKTVASVAIPPPEEGQPVTILIPSDKLRRGRHELAIYGEGAEGKPIQTYPFDFAIQ